MNGKKINSPHSFSCNKQKKAANPPRLLGTPLVFGTKSCVEQRHHNKSVLRRLKFCFDVKCCCVCHVWLKHFRLGSPVINIRIHLTYKIPLNYLLENRYASFLLFRFSPQGTGISEEVFCQIETVQVKILHSLIMYMILNLRALFQLPWNCWIKSFARALQIFCISKMFNFPISEKEETQIFAKFFHYHMCYDLIPTSAKLVVFDTQLFVKKAFSVYFLLFPYPKNFSQFFSLHWKK